MAARLIYSTWPDEAQAEACAATLVERRLAACVTILPGARSVFRWNGEVERKHEAVMLVKTAADRAWALRDALREAHPYEVPCILAFDVNDDDSNKDFLQWAAAETR
jgi:periplasmic divalent cation tolerance protein